MMLYLLRHGQTDWNVEGRIQGQADTALNAIGAHQVAAWREIFSRLNLTRIYSSRLERAVQSAQLAVPACNNLEITPQLNERHYGIFQGHTRKELRIQFPEVMDEWKRDPFCFCPPGGESYSSLSQRVLSFFACNIDRRGRNESALVVTHAGPIRVILAQVLGLDERASIHGCTSRTATVTTLHKRDNRWFVLESNKKPGSFTGDGVTRLV